MMKRRPRRQKNPLDLRNTLTLDFPTTIGDQALEELKIKIESWTRDMPDVLDFELEPFHLVLILRDGIDSNKFRRNHQEELEAIIRT